MMSYEVYLSHEENYIVLKHLGQINGEVAMKRVQEAHRPGAELGITRYLVDLTEADVTLFRNRESASKHLLT